MTLSLALLLVGCGPTTIRFTAEFGDRDTDEADSASVDTSDPGPDDTGETDDTAGPDADLQPGRRRPGIAMHATRTPRPTLPQGWAHCGAIPRQPAGSGGR